MLARLSHRLLAVLLGDDASSPRASSGAAHDRRATARPGLGEVVALSPSIRNELLDRARSSGVLIGVLAAVLVPAWSLVDWALESRWAGLFLLIRLASDVPMLALVWVLAATELGRRRPELFTFLIMAVVQAEISWFIPRVTSIDFYLLGAMLVIVASGCLLVSRPRWTVRLVLTTWAALALCVLTAPEPMPLGVVLGTVAYLATASLIAVVAHLRRQRMTVRELLTRVQLEQEQERTRALLGKLERLSHEDPLTGLANRRRWDAEAATACASARDSGGVVGMVLLDIDHFKDINDRHGHAAGDEALRQVAALLSSRVRGGDLVARLGGDELAVLLPGSDLDRAVELAERLRAETAELPGFAPGEVTVSLGVAAAAGAEAFPMELMARADQQLYRAKITRNAVGAPRADLPQPRGSVSAARSR